MKDGYIIEQGDVDQIFLYPKQLYTKQLLESSPTLDDNIFIH